MSSGSWCRVMVQQVSALRSQLLDQTQPLPLRFRVLFSLRAVNTDEAVDALLAGVCPCARERANEPPRGAICL